MEQEDTINGVAMLLDEIDDELGNKRLSKRDRLYLRCNRYILESIVPIRRDVMALKRHDAFAWMQKSPKLATALIFSALILNSVINWSGIRRPIIQSLIHMAFGVSIPLDQLP